MKRSLAELLARVTSPVARDGETISVTVGIDLEMGKVALEFGKQITEIRLMPAKAREIGLFLIKGADVLEAAAGRKVNDGRG